MKALCRIACMSTLVFIVGATSSAPAHPLTIPPATLAASPAQRITVHCEEDCWHDSWRSHYRWGSGHREEWHDRWRSHFRWGSYGGYRHKRFFSRYLIVSFPPPLGRPLSSYFGGG